SIPADLPDDDFKYVLDLGILKRDPDNDELCLPANPIYREVIVRALTRRIQARMPKSLADKWMDGASLDMDGLLKEFQVYWRENCEMLAMNNKKDGLIHESINQAFRNAGIFDDDIRTKGLADDIENNLNGLANEALAHLVLYAFLQRVLNGGADIQREYALGRTRADICVTYGGRRYPLELKIKGVKSRIESVNQLSGYMGRCGAFEGWLVVFDKDFDKPWERKLSWETMVHEGKTIHVVGC
ncbi:MAG: hypothetical protein LBL95_02160, partial [Deltaproteobacteria bacterium]|nr:hypothetical protein [Deltaproteobacteria bacterium]